MGYYVKAIEGLITITPENIDKAFEAIVGKFKELNTTRPDYFQVEASYESLENALWDNQFEFEKDDDGYLRVYGFDDKWREQETLLNALMPFVTEDSHMVFMGEVSEIFVWTPEGIQSGEIIWEGKK
jgi:hypothetical protein